MTEFQTSDDLFQDEPSQTSFSFQCVLIGLPLLRLYN